MTKVCRWKFKIDFKLNFSALWYEGPDVIYAKDVRKYLCVTIHTLAQRQKLTRKIRTRSFAQYLPFAMMVIQFSSMKGSFKSRVLKWRFLTFIKCNHLKKIKELFMISINKNAAEIYPQSRRKGRRPLFLVVHISVDPKIKPKYLHE